MNNGFSSCEEDSRGPPDQICCLIEDGLRCKNQAGYASYSTRIQKTVTQRRLKLTVDNNTGSVHRFICDYHKNRIQSIRTKRRRKDSEDDTDSETVPEVDLVQLQMNTLRRYKRHYKVSARQGLNKPQLAETIMEHFKQIPIKEKEILTYFIYMVKSSNHGSAGMTT